MEAPAPEEAPNEVERLIQQIQAIQKELPKHESILYENERAFDEGAEEHYAMTGYILPSQSPKRRNNRQWKP